MLILHFETFQMPGFEGGAYGGEESADSADTGDTGLGDSQGGADMALLFQNQKQFYNNLIVSNQDF